MLIFTLLFSLQLHAARPEVELARHIGPFQLVARTRLPVEHANQESRWRIDGVLTGRRFRAELLCVWMPIAANKYTYYKQRLCQPVGFEYL